MATEYATTKTAKSCSETIIRLKRLRDTEPPEVLILSSCEDGNNSNFKKRLRGSTRATSNSYDQYISNLLSNVDMNIPTIARSNRTCIPNEKNDGIKLFNDISVTGPPTSEPEPRQTQEKTVRKPVILRRFNPSIEGTSWFPEISKKRKSDMVKVVDCIHEDHDVMKRAIKRIDSNKGDCDHSYDRRKRARISIINTQEVQFKKLLDIKENGDLEKGQKKRKSGENAIKGPLYSMVDAQLKQYHDKGPANHGMSHLEFLRSVIIPSCSMKNTKFFDMLNQGNGDIKSVVSNDDLIVHFLNLSCSDGRGTILHGAALWNDKVGIDVFINAGIDLNVQDAEGRTAMEIAKLCGHESIVSIISQKVKDNEDHNPKYVYDMYCIETANATMERHNDTKKLMGSTNVFAKDDAPCEQSFENNSRGTQGFEEYFELENGRCYWDECGGLVVEAMRDFQPKNEDGLDTFNEEDYDSNDEDYVGNDYPEDEESDIIHVDTSSFEYGGSWDDDDASDNPTRMTIPDNGLQEFRRMLSQPYKPDLCDDILHDEPYGVGGSTSDY